MIEQIILETGGFRFSFDVDYAWTNQEYVGMVVTFRLLSPQQEMTLHSARTSIAIADLRRLILYFEQHMEKLKEQNGDAEADVFVNEELDFQLQALVGNVEPPMDEMFGISCMVNVGLGRDNFRVYVGGESNITFEQARAFIRDVQMFIDELPTQSFESFLMLPNQEKAKQIAKVNGTGERAFSE